MSFCELSGTASARDYFYKIKTNSNQTVNNRHITHVHIIMLITIVCRQSDVNSNISLGTGIATNQKPFFYYGKELVGGGNQDTTSEEHFSRK